MWRFLGVGTPAEAKATATVASAAKVEPDDTIGAGSMTEAAVE